jgi:hypothetical protein
MGSLLRDEGLSPGPLAEISQGCCQPSRGSRKSFREKELRRKRGGTRVEGSDELLNAEAGPSAKVNSFAASRLIVNSAMRAGRVRRC